MAEGIVLVGGDEFRPGCEEMDRAILSAASGKGPSMVLVLPTAAVTGPQKAAADGVRHFSNLGAMARELMVLDRGHANDEHLIEAVSGASVVYFTGGSPTDLLAALVGSKLLAKLRAAPGRWRGHRGVERGGNGDGLRDEGPLLGHLGGGTGDCGGPGDFAPPRAQ